MTKDEAIAERIRRADAKVKREEEQALGIHSVQSLDPEAQKDFNYHNKPRVEGSIFLNQVGNAIGDILHGTVQPLIEHREDTALAKKSKEIGESRKRSFERNYKESPFATNAANIGTGIATAAGTAQFIPKALQVAENAPWLTRVAQNAITGIPYGAVNYVNPGESRLVNTGVSAVSSALFPEATRGLGKLFGKGVNAGRGKVGDEAAELIGLGNQHDVPIWAGDIAGKGSALQSATEFMEQPPFINVKGPRLEQQQAAKQAAKRTSEKYQQEMLSEEFLGPNGIKKLEAVANKPGPRQDAAKKLLESINVGGNDWQHILKSSGNAKLLRSKIHADFLYDKVGQLSDQFGPVDYQGTMKQGKQLLEKLYESPKANEKSIKEVSDILSDFIDKKGFKDLSFDQLREKRSVIANKISDYYAGNNANLGSKGAAVLTQLKQELEKDMEKFATSHSKDLSRAWKKADSFYKEGLAPYKTKALANALRDESNPDEIFSMFIKTGGEPGGKGTGRSVKFYEALDPKGQAAVRYGILKNAYEEAVDNTGSFSPAKFATYMEKRAAANDVFFKGPAKQEVMGFAKLMRHVERAGQQKAPDTGVKVISSLLGLAAAGAGSTLAPATTAVVGGGTLAVREILTNPKARALLLASNKLAPDSPRWATIINGLISIANQGAPTVAKGVSMGHEKHRYIPQNED